MVKVEYFETATIRKTGKMKEGEIRGEFFVNIQHFLDVLDSMENS